MKKKQSVLYTHGLTWEILQNFHYISLCIGGGVSFANIFFCWLYLQISLYFFGGNFFLAGKINFGGKISVSNYMFLLDEGNLVILLKGRCIFRMDNTKWYFCKNS